MSWSVDIPGQPPTTNHLYVRVRGDWNKMAKAPGVAAYQDTAVMLTRLAKPPGFKVDGQLRIAFAFYLRRDADCDNLMKAIQDSIAIALDTNDRLFLPCTTHKSTGHQLPHTIVTVG
jgi:Holliday junction resolvase RusA-like endonuclease